MLCPFLHSRVTLRTVQNTPIRPWVHSNLSRPNSQMGSRRSSRSRSRRLPTPTRTEIESVRVYLPVSIHQGVGAAGLEGRCKGIVGHFTHEVLTRWHKPTTQLLLVNYIDSDNVPMINVREQKGRTEKLHVFGLSFDPISTTPIPSSKHQS